MVVFARLLLLLLFSGAVLAGRGQVEAVALKHAGNTVEVFIGGKPFTTYYFDPAIAKSYLQPLRSATGAVVTRTYPNGVDVPAEHKHDPSIEPHQRPLYFAHGDINGNSFWTEQAFAAYYPPGTPMNFGRMVFRKLDAVQSGKRVGTIRALFDLVGADGKAFAHESQTFSFSGDGETRTIDCTFVVEALDKPVKFGDTKEGTFAIRLASALTAPTGVMVNSAGGVGEAQVWGKPADWVNVDGTVDGQKLGVAIFDSPHSFRHPTYWHARGYGLLAANPFGLSYFLHDPKQEGSYTLAPGASVTFAYRVLIHQGDYQTANIAQRYRDYARQP